jgi:trehalose utilization protein
MVAMRQRTVRSAAHGREWDRRQFLGLTAAAALGLGSPQLAQAADERPVRVRVWSEGTAPKSVYPQGIEGVLAEGLSRRSSLTVSAGRLDGPDSGLTDADLDASDVLVWWGHLRHDDVPEDRVRAVAERVKAGKLGLVALHTSYASKPFRALMGGPCEPGGWRDDGRAEHVAVAAPEHPIAQGVSPFTIPKTCMFVEPFQVPKPESVVLVSSWDSGETFRSGLTWSVEKGRVVYLRPGDDSFPVLFHPAIRRVIANAAVWAAHRS